jgi:hypothetical protein
VSAIKANDLVRVVGGGDRTYLVRAVGDAGKDVYVVGDPTQNLGTWVDIRDVTLAEFGRAER